MRDRAGIKRRVRGWRVVAQPLGRVEQDGSQLVLTNAGYYHDDLVRTEVGWRIQHRFCEQTLTIGQLPEGYVIPQ